jgi:hypothetical protein
MHSPTIDHDWALTTVNTANQRSIEFECFISYATKYFTAKFKRPRG